jgi:hypothetical protein
MRNRYPGPCRDCGQPVAAEAGYFHKQPKGSWPKWTVRCVLCVAKGKLERGDSLSNAQWDAIREHRRSS